MLKIFIFSYLTLLFLVTTCLAHEDEGGLICPDPRPTMMHKSFTNGKEVEDDKGAFVIIAWADKIPLVEYQIWGSNLRLKKAKLETVLPVLMAKSPRDLYIVGNNWGVGRELSKVAKDLSKKHSIDVYFGSPFAFTKVKFKEESKETKLIISESINLHNKTK